MEANILTVIAILVAGYTLLSEEKRIDLHLRMGWIDKLLLLTACAIVAYVTFIPVLSYFKLTISLPWLWGFNANLTTFSVILLVLIYLIFKLLGKRLPHSRIQSWNDTSLQLLRQRKYKELSYLVDKYHLQFCSIHKDKWYDRLRSKLPSIYRDELEALIKGERKYLVTTKWGIRVIDWLIPTQKKIKNRSKVGLQHLLHSKSFVQYYALHNPQACMELTLLPWDVSGKFSDLFLHSLILDTESTFYREVRDTQQISISSGYYIDPANPFLFFYLSDLKVARDQQIWKPIGDSTATYISKQTDDAENYYNQPYHWSYEDEERWVCPIYTTLHFFDVMVQRAIYSNFPDHMWLRYYYTFLKHILENYQPSTRINKDSSMPTRYDYLVDEIFDNCISWLEAAIDKNVILIDKRNQLWPIPVSFSAKTLGELLLLLLQKDNFFDSRCTQQLSKVIRISNKLEEAGLTRLNKEIAKMCLPTFGLENTGKYQTRLKKCFVEVDPYETSLNSTLCKEIKIFVGIA
ncbi:tripartite tricarboxylate transporter TctB family protein [Grimontia hollisae]|uniref:tripartite tricarboxylate transporter TctB family protein n=1 Tax=Grimontia hollisae TaxID=673 RepID=UPI0018EEFE39|nr:tripartite tricarboxylate transporter TctB family protein [Grimontia hollisae]